jgi:hypothetical protein
MYKNEAAIAVKVGGKVVREIEPGKVNIPFKSEYSVYFKNLSDRSCVVKVTIDGEDVLKSRSLIFKANDSIDLERYVDNYNSGNKFKFIAMTDNIAENRGVKTEDGIVRVEWQFEKKVVLQEQITIDTWPRKQYFVDPNQYWYGNNTVVCDSMQLNVGSNLGGQNISRGIGGQSVGMNLNSVGVASASCYSANIQPQILCGTPNLNVETKTSGGMAGFTTKGSESNQQFKLGSIGTLESNKYSACIYMMGVEGKVITTKDKIECEVCGKVNPYTSKFCSECGTYLSK